MATVMLNTRELESYQQFLKIKSLPTFSIQGRMATFPDEYASMLGIKTKPTGKEFHVESEFLFDYQRDIAEMAIRKQKFCIFADCGLGKTLMYIEFIKAAMRDLGKKKGILIVSPIMVIDQTLSEAERWYGMGDVIERIAARDLNSWLATCGGKIGITNYEAIKSDLERGALGGLVLDESSMLKSHYGKWGTKLVELGRGLQWKLAGTGTPAPNDRIEYANHAVFMDESPTVNAFLARYFVNRGQTGERWELKKHALRPFYRSMSHWCIFLTDPATYGWNDNTTGTLPPIKTTIHQVDLTAEQERIAYNLTGTLFANEIGGITSRSQMGSIAKGWYKGKSVKSNKSAYIKQLVESWPDESTIIWCIYNKEQELIGEQFPDAAYLTGTTPYTERMNLVDEFKRGDRRVLISKAKILGFGLNLQVATRQVFSGLQDSYEAFYQCVKRSNRIGSTKPLNVHIPVTDLERPMIETVLKKASRVQDDAREQELIFKSQLQSGITSC